MKKIIFKKIQKELPEIQENVSLVEHTTFRIGGAAKYFYKANTKEELIKAVKIAKKNKLPFFILGGGSNLLVSDKGFDGLVIKIFNTNYLILNTKINTEAGILLSLLVSKAVENSLKGLEWGISVPGTVGGAIKGNAGAFGESIGNIIKQIEVFNSEKEKIENYSQKDGGFAYRESVFKKRPELIILSAELELKIGNKEEIQKKMKEYLDYRKDKQPLGFPSAGSIFKNPSDVSVGQLVDQCGLKGKRIGNVEISKKHANFIINLGDGKAENVLKLIDLMKKQVKDKFNIQLEEEIQYVGFK